MKINNFSYKYSLYEILITILPISLLFSNLISELILIFFLISIIFKINFNILKIKILGSVFFLLIFIYFYLIFNFSINIDKDPSFSRSFFFIRFPLYAFSIYLILDIFKLDLKKIFFSWLFISMIISFDIFYQYNFGKNIFGYKSILQGDFYRLGGFLNDELKIANLIIHIFVPVFVFLHQTLTKNLKNHVLLFVYVMIVFISVFLTGERSNFITLSFFLSIYVMFTNLRKNFLILFIVSLPIIFFYLKTNEPNLTKRMTTALVKIYKTNLYNGNEKGFFYKNNQYFAHYSTALEIGKDYPFFGVGLKNFRKYCDNDKYNNKIHPDFVKLKCSTHPHNFYFELISETGFVGLFIFLMSFFIIFKKFLIQSYKNKDNFLFGNTLILIIFFIPLLPKGSFFTNWNAMIFWITFSFCLFSYKKFKND